MGIVLGEPRRWVKLPKIPEGRLCYLIPPELKLALEMAPEWMRAPIALAAFTGMRRGELLGLRWLDVDLLGRRIYLSMTKNGRPRILVLNELALQVLMSLPQGQPTDAVFAGVNGLKLSVYTRRLFARLVINEAYFHTLRHTHASMLAMVGSESPRDRGSTRLSRSENDHQIAHLSPEYMENSVSKLDRVFDGVMPVNIDQKQLN